MILFEALQAVINAQENQSLREVLENPAGFAQKQAAKADKTKSAETAGTQRKRSDVVLTYQELQTLWKLYQGNKEAIEEVLKNPKNAQLKTIITALQAAQAPIAAFMEKNPALENVFNEFLKSYKTAFPTTDIPAAPALKAFLEIMFTEEGNPLPEDLYKKFQGVFGSMREVMVYLNAYKEDIKKGFSVHDSLLFELPDFESITEEWRTFWHGMAKEHLKDTPFRKILGQANDLTQFMIDNEKELEMQGVENFSTLHKKLKAFRDLENALLEKGRAFAFDGALKAELGPQLNACRAEIKRCEAALAPGSELQIKLAEARKKINASIKEERRIKTLRTALVGDDNPERDRLNEQRTAQEKITAQYQLELVKLAPTMAEITLTDILAYKTAYIQKMQGSLLGYFTKNQLTLKDFEYFQTLCASPGNKTAGKNLPDIKFDFERGGKRYYVKKLHVQNPEEAAIAACLGKLTGCCQYLGGVGADCAVHGLTNENSGFYVVYQGDINHPKITDPLVGQCWAWRSQTGAIVFDSVEPNRSGDRNIIDLGKHAFRELAHKLVSTGVTHKVDCGDSGMSRYVGVFTKNALETLENYTGYSDARERQLGIYGKDTPYYLCEEEEWARKETSGLLELLLSSQDSQSTESLLKLVEFADSDKTPSLYTILDHLQEQDSRIKLALRILSVIKNPPGKEDNREEFEKISGILEGLKCNDTYLYFSLQGGTYNKNLLMCLDDWLVTALESDAFKTLSQIQKMSIFTQLGASGENIVLKEIKNENNAALKIILSYLSLEQRVWLMGLSEKKDSKVLKSAINSPSYPGSLEVILESLESMSDENKVDLLYYGGLNERIIFGMLRSPEWDEFLMRQLNRLSSQGNDKEFVKFMGCIFYNKNSIYRGFDKKHSIHNKIAFSEDEKIKDMLKIYEFFDKKSDNLLDILDILDKNNEYWFSKGRCGDTLLHYVVSSPELLQKALVHLKKLPTAVQFNILNQKNDDGNSILYELTQSKNTTSTLKFIFDGLSDEELLLMIGKRPKQDYKFCIGSAAMDLDDVKTGEIYLCSDKSYLVRQAEGGVNRVPFMHNNDAYIKYFDDLEGHIEDPEFKKAVLGVVAQDRRIPYEGEALIELSIRENKPEMLDFLLSSMPKPYKADMLDQPVEAARDLVVYAIQESVESLRVLLKHYGIGAIVERMQYFFEKDIYNFSIEPIAVILGEASGDAAALFKLFESCDLLKKCAFLGGVYLKTIKPYFYKLTEDQKVKLLSEEFVEKYDRENYTRTLLFSLIGNTASFSEILDVALSLNVENRRSIIQKCIDGKNILCCARSDLVLFKLLLSKLTAEEVSEMLLLKNKDNQYVVFENMTLDVFSIMFEFIKEYPGSAMDLLCTPAAMTQAANKIQLLEEIFSIVDRYPGLKKVMLELPGRFDEAVKVASYTPTVFLSLMGFLESVSADEKLKLLAKKQQHDISSALERTLKDPEMLSVVLKIITESSDPAQYVMDNALLFFKTKDDVVAQFASDLLKKLSPQRRFELFYETNVGGKGAFLIESTRDIRVLNKMLLLLEDLSEPQLFSLLSQTATAEGRTLVEGATVGVLSNALFHGTFDVVLKLMEKLTPEHQLRLLNIRQVGVDTILDIARWRDPAACSLLEERVKALQAATLMPSSPAAAVLSRSINLNTTASGEKSSISTPRQEPGSPRSHGS